MVVPLITPDTLFGELTARTSVTAPAGRVYTNWAACPSPCPAFWEAIPMIAENIGQARLVPPITPTLSCPLKVSIISMLADPCTGGEIIETFTGPGRVAVIG